MPNLVEDGIIKCPCAKCRNCVRHKRFTIEIRLCRFGFKDTTIAGIKILVISLNVVILSFASIECD